MTRERGQRQDRGRAGRRGSRDRDHVQRVAGVVIRVDSRSSLVDTADGLLRCSLRGRLSRTRRTSVRLVAVGDRVEVAPGPDEGGVIERVMARRTKLSRRATGPRQREQIVAANVDQTLVVASLTEPPLNLQLVDRYLVAADHGGMSAVICLNKIDRGDVTLVRTELETYAELGYAVIETSARSGAGIDRLRRRLRDRTTVVAGASGVGKSTLINAVQPGLELRTAPVSEKSGEGRHTTAAAQLLKLDAGGYVIDTPGIREYTLWEIEPDELDQHFPEIDAFREGCRFSDCTHSHEPECGVKEAVERGDILPRRYSSYLQILEETRGEARLRDDPARHDPPGDAPTRPAP